MCCYKKEDLNHEPCCHEHDISGVAWGPGGHCPEPQGEG